MQPTLLKIYRFFFLFIFVCASIISCKRDEDVKKDIDVREVGVDKDTLKVEKQIDTLKVKKQKDTLKVNKDIDTIKSMRINDSLKERNYIYSRKVEIQKDTFKVEKHIDTSKIKGLKQKKAHKIKKTKDTLKLRVNIDTLKVGESKSGYENIDDSGGENSVGADLKNDDKKKEGWFSFTTDDKLFNKYYNVKRTLNKKIGLSVGMDYMFLNQFATFSYSDKQASSGIYRFFGNWSVPMKNKENSGSFNYKIENRHLIGKGVVPRNLGYEAGSALSTASFKDFQWGLTNFYWIQHFQNKKYSFVVGIIDPGDWLDLYPLLNPYKYYLNEAFFNSPAMALPNQGLGAVISIRDVIPNFYFLAGIQDANGEPTYFLKDNFNSFFSTNEFMYWAEVGWIPKEQKSIFSGETVHLMYWYQDPRELNESDKGWGLSFSASHKYLDRYTLFLRGGFATGNAPTMRHLVMAGIGMDIFKHDQIGFGLSYGAPSDITKGNQLGLEAYYTLQLTEHLNIMPNFQLTVNPSFNDEKDVIAVFSVFRMRYAL